MSRLVEIHDVRGVQPLEDATLPLAIGSGDAARIRFDGDCGVVAYLGESRAHLFLQPAVGAHPVPVFHNDEPLEGSVWLKSGDVTRVGRTLLRWEISGRRIAVRIVDAGSVALQPPPDPPPRASRPAETLSPDTPVAASDKGRRRLLIFGVLALLLACAAFVLLAAPLEVEVSPAPDTLSVSGFPPVISFGGRFLGLPGRYTLQARKRGYRPLVETVVIGRTGGPYRFVLEPLPGVYTLTSSPPGATVSVDDRAVGMTPLQDLEIAAGQRRIRFDLPRYRADEREILVEGFGRRGSLQAVLQPAWAAVTLETQPSGATVVVDGVEQGLTPIRLELVEGVRSLQFRREAYAPLETDLAVTAGEALVPEPFVLEPAPGRVTVVSVPAGATVTVDGAYRGVTPLTLALRPERKHTLSLGLSGHQPEQRTLTLVAGAEQSVDIRLKPEYGTVFITAEPADARLAIDGAIQSTANGRFRLPTRPHRLELSADGYTPLRRTVTPQAGFSQRLDLALTPFGAKSGATAAKPSEPAARIRTALDQELVLIRPTPFQMGASRNEPGRRANEAEHHVALQRPFYLGAREVTNREFAQYRAEHASGMVGNRSLEIASHPVVNVSWDDAVRFLNWLSSKDGLPPFYREIQGQMRPGPEAGPGYRLPTEAEWAFAARMAGRTERARYPWAGSYPPPNRAGNFADTSARPLLSMVIDSYRDGFPVTAPVGSFAASPAGLFDLGGNVAEWCHDYYAAAASDGGKVDPMGPLSGVHKVVRGSSWRDASVTELRLSYRRYSQAPADDIGFRIARYAQ